MALSDAAPRRRAEQLMHTVRVGSHALYDLIGQSVRAYGRHDMAVHAAALAYRVLFSIFPFIVFLIALLSFFDLQAFFGWLRQEAGPLLPQPALAQIDAIILELLVPQTTLLSLGAASALWLASSGMRQLMKALNVVYAAKESRPLWIRFPLSIVYTLGIALMLTAAATLMHFGPRAIQWFGTRMGMGALFLSAWEWLRWPVAMTLSSLAVAIAYHFAPNVRRRFRLFSAGSLLSVLAWGAAAMLFNYYVAHFANYDVMFGSIGAVIVLLAYIHISIVVLLFGAEVDAAIEQRTGEAINPDAPP